MNYMSTINIIVKNEFGEICYVTTLKYNSKKMKDFDDIVSFVIFFNDTATTEIYTCRHTLSLPTRSEKRICNLRSFTTLS